MCLYDTVHKSVFAWHEPAAHMISMSWRRQQTAARLLVSSRPAVLSLRWVTLRLAPYTITLQRTCRPGRGNVPHQVHVSSCSDVKARLGLRSGLRALRGRAPATNCTSGTRLPICQIVGAIVRHT